MGVTAQQSEIIYTERQHLAENLTSVSRLALDYLVLSNGGAAVACIAFIGSSYPAASGWPSLVALSLFILGIALAGWMTRRMHKYVYDFLLEYERSAQETLYGGMNLETFRSKMRQYFIDTKGSKKSKLNMRLGLISLWCFFVGVIFSLYWLWDTLK